MEYRNSSGGVHFGHSLVSNHESSHGVELTGGSTGGVIRPASDDASAALSIRAKGPAGILALGTSTGGPLQFNSTGIRFGNASTVSISAIQRYAVDFTPPALAVSEAAWQTYPVTGLSTASAVFISPHLTFSSNYSVSAPRCSTAGELSVLWTNNLASTIGTGESTNQWRVMEFRF